MPIDYKLDRPPERADLMVKRELSVIPNVNPLRAIRRLIEGLEGNMESIREKPEDRPPPRSPCGHRGGIGGANQATSRRGRERACHHHHVNPHTVDKRLLYDPVRKGQRLLLVDARSGIRPGGERDAQPHEIKADVDHLA